MVPFGDEPNVILQYVPVLRRFKQLTGKDVKGFHGFMDLNDADITGTKCQTLRGMHVVI